MSTEILHTADTHLGYRQYHKPEREEDFREAFERLVTEAIDRDVDAVVHAGDLFNRSRPSISSLSNLVKQLNRLQSAEIGFYTIVGNHDGTRERQWPEFLEDLGLAVYLGYDGNVVGDVTLYGQDFVSEGQRSRLEYDFEPCETEYAFLVSHGLFQPFPHGNWDIEEVFVKSTVSFDAALLGDDHTPRITRLDEVPITYPGSTERTAADQEVKRGYNIVTVDESGVGINHETIDTRYFHYIDVELETDNGLDTVLERIEEETIPDECVVVVTITGDGKRVPSADIENAGLRDGALTVQVNDRRDFEDSESEFQDVEFTNPDELVGDRKAEIELSPVGDELEEIARDLEGVPQSNLKDLSEEKVSTLIDEREVNDFVKNREPNQDVGKERDETTSSKSTGSRDDNNDAPEFKDMIDESEIGSESTDDKNDDPGQMSLGDL